MARVQSGHGWPRVEFMQEIALSMKQGFSVGQVREGSWSQAAEAACEKFEAGITSRKTAGLMALRASRLKAARVVFQSLCLELHECHRASALAACAGIG